MDKKIISERKGEGLTGKTHMGITPASQDTPFPDNLKKQRKIMGFTKAEICGIINQRIKSMETDCDGWNEDDIEIAQEELRMLIRRLQKRKLISELRREMEQIGGIRK